MSRFALVKEKIGGGKTEQLIKTAVSIAKLKSRVLFISIGEPDTLAMRIARADPDIKPGFLMLRQYKRNVRFSSIQETINRTGFETLIVDNAHNINAGGIGYEDNLKKILFYLMCVSKNTMVSVNIIRSDG